MKVTVKELREVLDKLPKSLDDVPLVYASDEEGNSYDYVCISPILGTFRQGNFKPLEMKDYAKIMLGDKKNSLVLLIN